MTTPAPATRFYNQTLVQVADTWPTSDVDWTTIRGWATSAADGLSNDVGSASITHPGGMVIWPGSAIAAALVEPNTICGMYIRVLLEAPGGGGAVSDGGKTYDAIWWGKVVSRSWKPNSEQTGLEVRYECAGILSTLDQMQPLHHYEVAASGLVPADIGEPLEVNIKGHGKKGQRSAVPWDISGISAYVFDKNNDAEWTALQLIEYFLAILYETNPGGPQWTVAGATSALGYKEKWELSGMTTLEVISRLISPRNGLGYRMEMVGFQPTIHVMSLSGVSVASDTYTLPASAEQVSLDLTDPSEIIDFNIEEDQKSRYETVAIFGASPIYIATLDFRADGTGAIVQDWTFAQETAFLAAIAAEEPIEGELTRVGRRFKIRDDWNGSSHDGQWTMPVYREVATSALHGANGFTGALTNASVEPRLVGNKYTLTRDLPVPTGYDWSTQAIATADFNQKPHDPLVFYESADTTTFEPFHVTMDNASIALEIDEHTGAISFGASLAEDVLDYIAAGDSFLFTLAIRGQMPLAVSWNYSGSAPVEQPRSIVRLRPHFSHKVITKGAIFSSPLDVPGLRASEDVIASDLSSMRDSLALAVAWYGRSSYEIGFQKIGAIDTAIGKPGTFYTDVTYRNGVATSNVPDTQAIVTRREFDFTDARGMTKITTKRIKLDIETVF